MKCPRCGNDLHEATHTGNAVHDCAACQGAWIGGASLHRILAHHGRGLDLESVFEEIAELEFDSGRRQCPACRQRPLMAVDVDDTEVDFCTACKGMFFDPGELETILAGIGQKKTDATGEPDSTVASLLKTIVTWFGKTGG